MMVMAVRGLPLKLTGDSPIHRSKRLPVRVEEAVSAVTAQLVGRHRPVPARTVPAARLLSKERREGVEGIKKSRQS
ncbi:hypothetical protein D3C76_1639870 [compost metagenome]